MRERSNAVSPSRPSLRRQNAERNLQIEEPTRAEVVHNQFSNKTRANEQLNFGRQQAQTISHFGLASLYRRVATVKSHIAHSVGLGGLSFSEARTATDRAIQAKTDLRAGANSLALDSSPETDVEEARAGIRSLKGNFAALENALLAGPSKTHQQSHEIHNEVGSRALLKAEQRTSSTIEGLRSTQARVARGALRILDSEKRPNLRAAAKFSGLYQAAFKSAYKDQHTELASKIEGTVRKARGYASEAYKQQARADVAETAGDIFRTGETALKYSNKIAPTGETKLAESILQGAGGIASLIQAGFSHYASKRFETASNKTYQNSLMPAFFGAKHFENKESARLGAQQAWDAGESLVKSHAGDAGVSDRLQSSMGIERGEGEISPEFSGAGIARVAVSEGVETARDNVTDAAKGAAKLGFEKFFSRTKRIDRSQGMRGYLTPGPKGVKKAHMADAANTALLIARGVGQQGKPELTRQNAQKNIHIEAPTKAPMKRQKAQRTLQIDTD